MRISDWSSDVCSSDLMDELQEEDKVLVGRARRIQKFLGQNFIVAEKFTGEPGSVVPLRDTIEAFDRVCKGEFDHLPEQAFNSCGGLDAVEAAAQKMAGKQSTMPELPVKQIGRASCEE